MAKQAVGETEEISEFVTIPNKYKHILDDLIDSSDIKSPDHPNSLNQLVLIDKKSRNISKSREGSATFLEKNC